MEWRGSECFERNETHRLLFAPSVIFYLLSRVSTHLTKILIKLGSWSFVSNDNKYKKKYRFKKMATVSGCRVLGGIVCTINIQSVISVVSTCMVQWRRSNIRTNTIVWSHNDMISSHHRGWNNQLEGVFVRLDTNEPWHLARAVSVRVQENLR